MKYSVQFSDGNKLIPDFGTQMAQILRIFAENNLPDVWVFPNTCHPECSEGSGSYFLRVSLRHDLRSQGMLRPLLCPPSATGLTPKVGLRP